MPTPDLPICENCKYAFPLIHALGDPPVECRVYPPSIFAGVRQDGTPVARFPPVEKGWWCSLWAKR